MPVISEKLIGHKIKMKKAPKVAIIDYEAGNLYSVQHACSFVGLDSEITADNKKILASDGALLPGVGAFGEAMENLKKKGLVETIYEFVASGKPFMGVCLGLQLLFSQSEEFGLHKGLDLIRGKVQRFPNRNSKGEEVKVPQIGWNRIYIKDKKSWEGSPLKGISDGEFMYFVHSFYAEPKGEKDILTLTDYEGIEYCSSVKKDNIFATQFHPEKSAQEGIKIYRNWAKEVKKLKVKNERGG